VSELLRELLAADPPRPEAIEAFIDEHEFPYVDGGDVTFVFRGAADEVRLRHWIFGLPSSQPFHRLDGTDLTYIGTPIVADDGATYLASMHFDLAPMRRESVRLIIDLVIAVVLGSAMFSGVVYLLVRRSLVAPLREVTRNIEEIAAGQDPRAFPEFETRELSALSDAVARACRARGVPI